MANSFLSRATWLILCVREAPLWHARPSRSVFIQQVLSDDAEAEFFLDDVTVEGPAGVFTLTKEYVLGSKLTGLHP